MRGGTVEHLAVVLWARLRHKDSSRFNNNTGTNDIVRQPVSVGMRHSGPVGTNPII
jgi:hypothetical protein